MRDKADGLKGCWRTRIHRTPRPVTARPTDILPKTAPFNFRLPARIFTAPSVVNHPWPLRVYRAEGARVIPIDHPPSVVRRDAARLLFRAMRDASPAL